jgi:hypothetical protein
MVNNIYYVKNRGDHDYDDVSVGRHVLWFVLHNDLEVGH